MERKIEKKIIFSKIITFIARGVLGMTIVYFVNLYLNQQGVEALVGINFVTFFTSGSLGFPGVALLYGIMLFQIL